MLLSVIILAKTDSNLSFNTTINCIETLKKSEDFTDNFKLEIIIVESNKNYNDTFKFPKDVKIIVPEETFGFHKFLNIGIKASKGKFIALCNNDLLFYKNWFSEILDVYKKHPKILSFSPIDPRFEVNKFSGSYSVGYKVTQQIKGWCLVCHKDVIKKIKKLDENFQFYYSDNDYALTLLYHNIKHAVVTGSKVQHLHKVITKDSEKKDSFFTQIKINTKIPKYLYGSSYKWLLENERALFDHLTYYNKWGKPDSIYRIRKIAIKLNNKGLNFITKCMFVIKKKFKV